MDGPNANAAEIFIVTLIQDLTHQDANNYAGVFFTHVSTYLPHLQKCKNCCFIIISRSMLLSAIYLTAHGDNPIYATHLHTTRYKKKSHVCATKY